MAAEKRMVTRIWHPEQSESLHHLGDGKHAEVLTGAAAYQLSTGDIIAL